MESPKITQEREERKKELINSLAQTLRTLGHYANLINDDMKGAFSYRGEEVPAVTALNKIDEDFANVLSICKKQSLIHYHELEIFMREYTALKSVVKKSENMRKTNQNEK